MFKKIKLHNMDKVGELRSQFATEKIGTKDIPHDILVQLFLCAITRIDRINNNLDNDIRDFETVYNDQNRIIDNLFNDLEQNIRLDIYE